MDPRERTLALFGYEMHGGRKSILWRSPMHFELASGQGGKMADADFEEWGRGKRNFSPEEIPGGKWVKVSDQGGAYLVECHHDGTLTESGLFDPKATWPGSWRMVGSALRITVGEYELDVIANRNGNIHSGLEFKAGAYAPHAYFRVIHLT